MWIKPSLGYGKDEKRDPSGRVVIPANSVLVFDLDMLDYRSKLELQRMQMQQQMQQGGAATGGLPPMPGAAGAGAAGR